AGPPPITATCSFVSRCNRSIHPYANRNLPTVASHAIPWSLLTIAQVPNGGILDAAEHGRNIAFRNPGGLRGHRGPGAVFRGRRACRRRTDPGGERSFRANSHPARSHR